MLLFCISSFWAASESGYVVNVWIAYLMDITLCLDGWHDVLCIMWLAAVGFCCVFYSKAKSVLLIVISRKLMSLFCSFPKVNDNFGWMLLKFAKGFSILVQFSLYINRMLSVYLQYYIIRFSRNILHISMFCVL